ncbi:hypothetical protein FBEOM_3195 [Fusarium beomiforme]|uniref:Uncharacterized protein n=1 Tax=Fusarium beomiforme TaxID=44412 RepID=A0A9P5E149_9HYPO|nr:hypothetical protein FBEOM_3195 [Fusarium beomiforme]
MEDTNQPSPTSSPNAAPLSHLVKFLRKITPPERKPHHLPSPPTSGERKRTPAYAVDELPQDFVDFKRKHESGGGVSPLTSFPLSKEDYTRLHPKLEADFRRFNYEPRRQRISFHMPSTTRELFI